MKQCRIEPNQKYNENGLYLLIPKHFFPLTEIGKEDKIDEVNEDKLSEHKYKKEHHDEDFLILGMIERSAEKIIISIVVEKSFLNEYQEKVLFTQICGKDTIILKIIRKTKIVNHYKYFKDPNADMHVNTNESIRSSLKVNYYREEEQRKMQVYFGRVIVLEMIKVILLIK